MNRQIYRQIEITDKGIVKERKERKEREREAEKERARMRGVV